MSRYFFHVRDGVSDEDEEGVELADLEAVRKEAVSTAASILRDLAAEPWLTRAWALEVTDQEGQVVFRLAVREEERGPQETERLPSRQDL
jgi:hypothetical protein